jgi:hypothetical protein
MSTWGSLGKDHPGWADKQALNQGGTQGRVASGRALSRVDFIVTNVSRAAERVVALFNKQWIKKGNGRARSIGHAKRPATNTNGSSVKPGNSLRYASTSVLIRGIADETR